MRNKLIAVKGKLQMDMKQYIEIAERKAGKQIDLAKFLDISTGYIRNVKAGKSGLPVEICIILADFIEKDRLEVIAASNLVTEKDEKKRKILESCFTHAASVTFVAFVISILTFAPIAPTHAALDDKTINNINY
ncbi:hypothetical protein SAMN05216302_100411 [Nitrosomonas aestuarii]|uniref:Helix-turn-helix n=1 Tax=Nitrosomonas aestuarii TaxID=52441 RepID=A0A1I3YIK0_9PROT|nr:helix-turn-helix domain-containing protein [Nitrosomonas aestuarii]SFK31654.1 hypothetical protein SAMN05216302_100411 [Nitrosomonas aestuarii]